METFEIGQRVLDLCPNDESYLYNQSISCEKVAKFDEALALVDRYMAIICDKPNPDEDHLQRAVITYAKAGLKAKTIDAFSLLKKHHPYIADVVKGEDNVEAILNA